MTAGARLSISLTSCTMSAQLCGDGGMVARKRDLQPAGGRSVRGGGEIANGMTKRNERVNVGVENEGR